MTEVGPTSEGSTASEAVEDIRNRLRQMLPDDDVDFLTVVAALSYVGYNQGEIADQLGLRRATLRSRLSRLRSRLRQHPQVRDQKLDLVTKEEAG